MRIIFLGDIVGRAAREEIQNSLPRIKEDHKIDFAIVNGENAAGGFGITEEICNNLFVSGVDCITTGNHLWDQREILNYLIASEKLRIKLMPSNQKHLSNLNFLTGDWFREGQTNDGQPYRLESNYEWGRNGNFIHGSWAFKNNGITRMSGNSTLYWDAVKEEIVKLGFDTRGNHYKSVLSVDEKGQVTELRTSTNQDGEVTELGFVIKRIDRKSYTRQRMSINTAGDLEAVGEESTITLVPKY